MTGIRWGKGIVVAMLLAGSFVTADDSTSLKAELADLKAKVASMESAQACGSSCGCGAEGMTGDCASLTSMKEKAAIKIGGSAYNVILVVNRDDDPLGPVGEDDEIDSTTFMGEAALNIRAYASEDVYLNLKLDLEDFWNNSVDQDDLLEECHFVWKNVACSNWSLLFGKAEVKAFGQDTTIGYMDGLVNGAAYLLDWGEEVGSANNAHGTVGTNALPGEVDNTFQVEASYKWRDLAVFKTAVFQDKSSRGMHEDRSDDHLGFQSFAAKLELMPVEGLTVEISGINRHQDSRVEADSSAISLGFTYKSQCLPLEFFGEYLHGWDVNWVNGMDTDTVQLGFIWGVTECIDVSLMGEWAQIDDSGTYEEEDYYSVYATVYYNFDNGISCGLEYMHQWFDGDVNGGGNVDADADMIGFVTSWSF